MKLLLRLMIGILWCLNANATHIVGGIMSVEHLSADRYKITLKVFRDCLNGKAPFDDPARVGIYDKLTHQQITTFSLNLIRQEVLPFAAASCDNSLPLGCTDMGLYEVIVQLNPSVYDNDEGYYLSYQRCCRNDIIQNIRDPGDAGIAVYTEIPSPKHYTNSTPFLGQNPNILLCKDILTTYNFGFTDPEGDVLKYEMTSPIRGNLTRNTAQDPPSAGPYPLTNWVGGFSNTNQINGSPSLGINPTTGDISVNPSQAGTYAIAIKVSEYRQGIKIGELTLELQLNVTACFQPAPAIAVRDSSLTQLSGNTSSIQTPHSACYTVFIEDPQDSVYVEIENVSADTSIFPKPVFPAKFAALQKTEATICWESACSLPLNTTQIIRIKVTDNGCPKFATTYYTLTLHSIPLPNHPPTDLLCMTLADEKQTTLYWGDSTPMTTYFKQYNIYRRVNGGPFVLIDSVSDKRTRSYTDLNTPDYSLNNYEYMMRPVNQCGNIGPSSDTLGTFEQLKFIPDKQQILTVTVVENQSINVIWPKTWEKDFARYFVYKKQAGDPVYKLVHQTSVISDTVFRDRQVDVSRYSYCYHVIMKDTCDNYGPGGYEACSILLSGEPASFENELWWTGYNWWCNGVESYELNSKGDQMPVATVFKVSGSDSVYTDDQLDHNSSLFSYWVVARQQNTPMAGYGGKSGPVQFYTATSTSNRIDFVQKPNVFVPNAFTPNNDNLNDTWNIRDLFVKDYKLTVYNKWGQDIFTTTDKNNQWNGKLLSGADAPCDVYIYVLTYTGRDDTALTLRGNVTLLR